MPRKSELILIIGEEQNITTGNGDNKMRCLARTHRKWRYAVLSPPRQIRISKCRGFLPQSRK